MGRSWSVSNGFTPKKGRRPPATRTCSKTFGAESPVGNRTCDHPVPSRHQHPVRAYEAVAVASRSWQARPSRPRMRDPERGGTSSTTASLVCHAANTAVESLATSRRFSDLSSRSFHTTKPRRDGMLRPAPNFELEVLRVELELHVLRLWDVRGPFGPRIRARRQPRRLLGQPLLGTCSGR